MGWTSRSDFDIVKSQQNNYHGPCLFVTVQIRCKSGLTYLLQENSDSVSHAMYHRDLRVYGPALTLSCVGFLERLEMPFQIRASSAVEDMMFAVMEPRFRFEPICRAVWGLFELGAAQEEHEIGLLS